MTEIKTYYSCAELAALKLPGMPTDPKNIRSKANSGKWCKKKREGLGGGYEYQPPAPIMALIRQHAMQQLVVDVPETNSTSTDIQAADTATTRPGDLKSWQREVAQARLAICREVQRLEKVGGKEKAIQTIIEMAKNGQLPERLQKQADIANAKKGQKRALSRTSIYRWLNKTNTGGSAFAQLAPKNREPKALPQWAIYLAKLYGQPQKPSLAYCVEKLPDVLPDHIQPPSYSACLRFIDKMSNVDMHRGRMGSREIKKILPFVRRDTSSLWPTDIYTSDGHTFDAEVAHPSHGRPFRPEVTTVLDVATRKAVGWSAGLAESTWTVADAVRHACTTCGIPSMFYVDKGAGFANDFLSNEVTGIAERLGFELTHSIPYNSQARGIIERVQKTIWVKAAKMLPTYMGKDMDPQARQASFKITRKDIQVSGTSKLLIDWPDFLQFCQQQINDYNDRPHKSLPKIRDANGKKRHQTPNEAWAEAVAAGFEPVEVEAWEQEDLFRPYKVCHVIRGEIRLFGNRYFHHDLKDYHGEKMRIGYDIHDAGRVWVRDGEDRLVCIAEFEGNSRNYFPESVVEQARYKRAAAKIKRAESRIEEAQAELDPPQLIEHQPDTALPPMTIQQSPDMTLVEEPEHLEDRFDATNIGVMPTQGAKRPWFTSDAEKYRWLMGKPSHWTRQDIEWLQDFVHTEYYENFREIFDREGIPWTAREADFAQYKLEKLRNEEKTEEDEVSAAR